MVPAYDERSYRTPIVPPEGVVSYISQAGRFESLVPPMHALGGKACKQSAIDRTRIRSHTKASRHHVSTSASNVDHTSLPTRRVRIHYLEPIIAASRDIERNLIDATKPG